MKSTRIAFFIVLMFSLLLNTGARAYLGIGQTQVQSDDQTQDIQTLFNNLSPEEKVGQLFLVSFNGIDASEKSPIRDLIANHYIGGVVLSRTNDNFVGPEGTLNQAYQLVSDLQTAAWLKTAPGDASIATGTPPVNNYIPLFISISQEGDLSPYDQILTGMTPLPDEMAIGATWNTEMAKSVGSVLGKELHTLGINMLIGPSLDVLDMIQPEGGQDLGTRTFGGDPFWVGAMGQAYIQGVHEGSLNGVAVIAKHFPGRGGSDRPPEEEVATVRKSLESLKQIELFPFFSVTGNAPNTASTTDGLLASHIRYQGFQGNIRATTRPISFDSAAMEQILSLPPFQTWRAGGGVVVCDNLGSPAVRKFYDPTGNSFDGRQVARNAFLAGNDLLIVDNFVSSGDPDQTTTLLKTLDLFTQKYKEDPAFAEKVDQSVKRILQLKFKLYPVFSLSNVLPKLENIATIGQSSTIDFDVAKSAVTLVSPNINDLPNLLPHGPEVKERILFVSDTLQGRQCTQCNPVDAVGKKTLMNAVLRLYGPQAGGQVIANNLTSYSYENLENWIIDPTSEPDLNVDLPSANWVVFSMLNISSTRNNSGALKDLLNKDYEMIRNKKIIVFSFNAPYYLDATDISKVLSYYALYSKIPDFFDVAARILFQELAPSGSLPVSVPGTGYDLITALSPDPNQIISLMLDLPEVTYAPGTPTPANPIIPSFFIGDTIPLRTGEIVDHNKNLVPDGTVVRFLFTLGGDTSTTQQMETTTLKGIARASFKLSNPGVLEIRAVSDPALISDVMRLEIKEGQAAVIIAIAPTLAVTPTLAQESNPAQLGFGSETPQNATGLNIAGWLLAILIVGLAGLGSYQLGLKSNDMHWGVRWGLTSAIGGLLAFILGMLSLSKSSGLSSGNIMALELLICTAGCITGWLIGWIWSRIDSNRKMGNNPGESVKSRNQKADHK